MKTPSATLFVIVSTIVVLVAIGAGLFLSGSPAQVRAERLDDQRIRDFLQIRSSIGSYWAERGSLPARLEDIISDEFRRFINIKDPESGEPYSYRLVNASSYELCAEFENSWDYSQTTANDFSPFWNHEQGRHCFTIEETQSP